jgi:2-iminobutanoate/2-iminopropanoate deaminase
MEYVHTDSAPAAIGPYSQAVVSQGFVLVSGQIPIDPSTGQLVEGPLSDQVRQVLSNLEAILVAAGSGRDRVVKVNVYLTDMDRFAEVNEVYADFFGDHRPARAAVQVARLPKDVPVEMELIAEAR